MTVGGTQPRKYGQFHISWSGPEKGPQGKRWNLEASKTSKGSHDSEIKNEN